MKGTVLYKANNSGKKEQSTNSESSSNSSKRLISKTSEGKNNMDCDMGTIETFQQQALEICEPGADFDPAAAPQSGEEYLMHMLYERKKHPAVMVRKPKKIQQTTEPTMAQQHDEQTIKPPSPHLLPTKEWILAQLEDFNITREKVTQLRQRFNAQKFEQNQVSTPCSDDALEWQTFCRQHPPLLSNILCLNQRSLEQLLEFICDWLETEETSLTPEEQQPSTSSSAAAASADCDSKFNLDLSGSNCWIGAWLYATLACLHLPLEPDVHSTLRDIARIFIRLRSRIQPDQMSRVVPYNLFISLIARVFGQLDFEEAL